MGTTVDIKCKCGYQEHNIQIGGGMLNSNSYCSFPIYCKRCQSLVAANLLRKPLNCPQCSSQHVYAYDDQQLVGKKGKNVIASWNVTEKLGRELKLTDGQYYCPYCQEFDLRFSEGNLVWD